MKRLFILLLLPLATLCLSGAASAAEGSVSITAPAEGAALAVGTSTAVTYEVTPGPRGDHVHLYDNGREIAIVRQLKGSHPVGLTATGTHDLCIKVVDKAHVPIGVEKCVTVKVQ